MRIEDIIKEAYEKTREEIKRLEADPKHNVACGSGYNQSPRLTRTNSVMCELWDMEHSLRSLMKCYSDDGEAELGTLPR